jgi:hypothetical protein
MLSKAKFRLAGRLMFVCCLWSVVCGFAFAQQYKHYNTFNKEAELQKFAEQNGKYKKLYTDIYKLTYPSGETRVFNFNRNTNFRNITEPSNTTIINIWEIDTTKYSDKFKFWQRVNIINSIEGIVFAKDLNHNGLLELYGYSEQNYPLVGPVVIFEQNSSGIFHKIFTYDSNTAFVQGIGDINSDGEKEIHLRTNDTINGKFYKSDSITALPTTFDFIFYYHPLGQINDLTFGDFDNNEITDCVFIDWPNTIIANYDILLNNFTTEFKYSISPNDAQGGFATGDFDEDGKTEIVFSTALKQVYVIEAEGTNQYSVTWQGIAPAYNAYMITSTNDIDGNGKPEFWVGGQNFDTGISTFWCYESDANNSYIPVAAIELKYLITLNTNYLQSGDIDNDGRDELIISLGNYLLILKFTGKPNQHNYEILYAKINELTQPGAQFLPVTIENFNNDSKKDILLPMERYTRPTTDLFSYLLVQDTGTPVSVDKIIQPAKFDILQNYPNPFNPSTQVKIILSAPSKVEVTVYNILGKEIKTLLSDNLSSGEHDIEWNGKDSEGKYLAVGIYFIQMRANSFNKTIKTILLR